MKNDIVNYYGKSLKDVPEGKKKEKKEKEEKHRIPLKKYTKGGRVSSLIALCSILVIMLAIVISIFMKGKAGIYVGLMMIVSLVASMTGFAIGIKSFNEENKFLRYTYIGTIANAVIWLGILGMYLIYI